MKIELIARIVFGFFLFLFLFFFNNVISQVLLLDDDASGEGNKSNHMLDLQLLPHRLDLRNCEKTKLKPS